MLVRTWPTEMLQGGSGMELRGTGVRATLMAQAVLYAVTQPGGGAVPVVGVERS